MTFDVLLHEECFFFRVVLNHSLRGVTNVIVVCRFQLFGDDVLRGAPKRPNSVVAVTDCEFAVLDESDYTTVKDRGLSQMTLDDKCHFLK